MARDRNIKPAFFQNEELVELSFSTRLLFIGLWTLADREGRMEDRPKRIKMSLFPADDLDIERALCELEITGFIVRYEHEESKYLQVVSFCKHQNPHRDEKASIIPAQHNNDSSTVQAQCKDDVNSVAIGLIPDSLNLIPDSLIDKDKNLLSSTDDVVVDELSKSSQPAKPRLACPVEKLIDVYHTAFPDGSRVKVITAARRAAAKARWLEASRLNVQPFRYANEAEGLAAWRKFFEVCAESDFLTGKVAPQAGRQTWVADFDFFMQPSSFAKCLENKYHREIAA